MSSAFSSHTFLTSSDMEMLSRVLNKVCAKYDLSSDGVDAQRVAVLLIREFQHGVSRESDLMVAFTSERPGVPPGKAK